MERDLPCIEEHAFRSNLGTQVLPGLLSLLGFNSRESQYG